MNTFEAITANALSINAELEAYARKEGLPTTYHTTGKVLVDSINEVVWFEIADEYNTCFWATDGYPENAAFEEKIVVVDYDHEALSYADDYNL